MSFRSPGADDLEEGAQLRALRAAFDDSRAILTGVGALLVKESQRAFREERMGNVRWKTRGETGMTPNWPGILADFAAGKSSPPDRRFQDRPVLSDTGHGRRSFSWRIVNQDTVEAGSMLGYLGALHAGEPTMTVPITAALQQRMWEWMKKIRASAKRAPGRVERAKGEGKEAHAKAVKGAARAVHIADMTSKLGWLLNKKLRGVQLAINHPPRPMVGLPKSLIQEIEGLYGKRFGRVA